MWLLSYHKLIAENNNGYLPNITENSPQITLPSRSARWAPNTIPNPGILLYNYKYNLI